MVAGVVGFAVAIKQATEEGVQQQRARVRVIPVSMKNTRGQLLVSIVTLEAFKVQNAGCKARLAAAAARCTVHMYLGPADHLEVAVPRKAGKGGAHGYHRYALVHTPTAIGRIPDRGWAGAERHVTPHVCTTALLL